MSIGESDAAEVLKHMGPKEVQRVGTSMSALSEITQEMVEGTVHLFLNEVGGQTSLGIGADDYIRSMLTKALGEDKNFLAGLNVHKGHVTYKAVADAFGYEFVEPLSILR